jgi:hypothetical protein
VHPVIHKWNSRINEILADFDGILAEATSASQSLLPQIELDLTPLTRPWGAVEHQKHRYTAALADAWDQVSDELSEIDDLPEGVMMQEGNKRDFASCEIEIRYTRAYRLVMAAAGDVMRERAIEADARVRACTHCGAPLDRIRQVSQALNVECGYCNAVNTVEPGQALRAFGASAAHYLGERAALPSWEEMTRAEAQMHSYRERREVPLGLLHAYQDAARRYFTTRLSVEAELVPEQVPYVATRVEGYMKSVQKTLREYWQWRQQQV